MKKAHEFIKKEEAFHEDMDEDKEEGGKDVDLVDVMKVKRKRWRRKWCEEDEGRIVELGIEMRKLMKEAKESGRMRRPKLKEVRQMLKELNDDRALGVDNWAPKEWQELPDEAIEALIDIIMMMEEEVAIPAQALLNIVALIPKPQGGDRPVALMSLVYVLWTRIRSEEFKEWDEARLKHWDDAVQGSSALKAALRRRMLDEVEVELEGWTASVYWDLEKFFDSIRPGRLIKLSRKCRRRLHPRMMAMAMQAHLAPRVLRARGVCSSAIEVDCSIVAGCRFSIGFARTVVYQLIEKAASRIGERVTVKQYVDDLAQSARGKKYKEVKNQTVEAALELKKVMEEEGLTVSDKTTLVCSSKELEEDVRRGLAAGGMKIKVARQVKDLGVDATGGGRRSTKTQMKRIKKAVRRAKKVKWMRKKSRKATKLYKCNVWPAAKYGIACVGAAPNIVQKMRTACAGAALGAQGHCATVAIDLGMGQKADPEISIRVEVVKDWIEIWAGCSEEEKRRIRRAWRKMAMRIDGKYRWREVKGPMGAVITTLKDMGWKVPAPDVWISPEGDKWEGDLSRISEALEEELEETMKEKIWERASRHRGGGGLQGGMDGTVIKKHLRVLADCGCDGKEALLRKAAAGAMWTRARRFEAGLAKSPTCLRCGKEDEDEMHRMWRCEANDRMDCKAAKQSESLKGAAEASNKEEEECFWTRGLVPKGWTATEEMEHIRPRRYGEEEWRGGRFYLDGSGGKKTGDKRMRRCAWAAVKLDEEAGKTTRSIQAMSAPLGGKKQTVPRAELTAAVEVLKEHRGKDVDIELVTDCMYVYKGAMKNKGDKGLVRNGDLWEDFMDMKEEMRSRGRKLEVRKVKAHAGLIDIYIYISTKSASQTLKETC